MPRFVLLRHECPPDWEKPSHWDFMLEVEGVLWTWELRELPATWARALGRQTASVGDNVPVTRLADHRVAYLEYEGPVSEGRGKVTQVAAGEFCWILKSPNQLEVDLLSRTLCGHITLGEREMAVK